MEKKLEELQESKEVSDRRTKLDYDESSDSDSGSESGHSTDAQREFAIVHATNFNEGTLKLKIATKRFSSKKNTITMDPKDIQSSHKGGEKNIKFEEKSFTTQKRSHSAEGYAKKDNRSDLASNSRKV